MAAAALVLLVSCTLPESVPQEQPTRVQLDVEAPPAPPVEAPEEPDPAEQELARLMKEVADLELRQKVAGLVVASIEGRDPLQFRAFLERNPVAGFLLMRGNLEGSPADTRLFLEAVQEGQPHPILFAVDQEGGFVARIPGDRLPSARELGTGDTGVTTETFRARQELVLQTGANVNLGVVADVSPGSRAYIHNRTFSGDPVIVTDHVGAALEGAVPGVAQTLKHFPGHGMVFEDSHQEIPETTLTLEQWRNTHALPFIAGVSGGVELVMTAHIRVLTVSKDPASLSDDWINILRAELGYQGVIITDDLSMLANSGEEAYQDPAATAVAALVAGNDLIMVMVDPADRPGYFTYDRIIDALVAAVVSGEISEEQVDASLLRVLALRDSLAIR